jgi:hypothetical protein
MPIKNSYLRAAASSLIVTLAVYSAAQVTKAEEVKAALVGLGYEVEDAKATDGRPIYSLVWKADDWTFAMDASLTPDSKTVFRRSTTRRKRRSTPSSTSLPRTTALHRCATRGRQRSRPSS